MGNKPRLTLTRPEMRAAALVSLGKTLTEIAEDTGLSVRTISRLKNESALFIQQVQEMTMKSVSTDLLALAPKAVKVLADQLDAENDWVRQNAAREILSRVAPVLTAQQNNISITFQGMPQLGAPPLDDEDDDVEAEGRVE